MERVAVFPGSFNPFTLGHADIVKRGLELFDRIVIGVGINEQKATSSEETLPRVTVLRHLYANEPRISVEEYSTLTVDFARQHQAQFILRGVRTYKDFEYEQQIAEVNRQISGIETVILFSKPELSHISSSIVRELNHFGKSVNEFLPDGLHISDYSI